MKTSTSTHNLSQFTTATLGSVRHPSNLLMEFLEIWQLGVRREYTAGLACEFYAIGRSPLRYRAIAFVIALCANALAWRQAIATDAVN